MLLPVNKIQRILFNVRYMPSWVAQQVIEIINKMSLYSYLKKTKIIHQLVILPDKQHPKDMAQHLTHPILGIDK